MKKLTVFLSICLVIGLQAILSADIRKNSDPQYTTADSINFQIVQLLDLNKKDHNEALCQIFGVYADIKDDTLETMISREFFALKTAMNSMMEKFVDDNELQVIDVNEVNLKLMQTSLAKMRLYEDFFELIVEVGAVPDGLKYLEQIFTKYIEILQIQQDLAATKTNNSLSYRSQGAKLISEKIVEIIIPDRRRLLQSLDNDLADPEIKLFVNKKSNEIELISRLKSE